MKKLIIAALAFCSVSYASAQATEIQSNTETKVAALDEQDKRTPVKPEELPDVVKKSLAADPYAGWTPTAAFWVEGKSSSWFEIELSKGEDKSFVKYDKSGQLVK